MGSDKRHKRRIASVEGPCGSCRETAELTLYESRRQRRALDVFRRGLDDRVDRWITCSACRRAYPAGATTLFDDPQLWVEPGRGAAAGEAWDVDGEPVDDDPGDPADPAEDDAEVQAVDVEDAEDVDDAAPAEAPAPPPPAEPAAPHPTAQPVRRRRATRPQRPAGPAGPSDSVRH